MLKGLRPVERKGLGPSIYLHIGFFIPLYVHVARAPLDKGAWLLGERVKVGKYFLPRKYQII